MNIQKTDTESPYFDRNWAEIENLIPKDFDQSVKIEGWCNAYGYELNIESVKGIHLRVVKSKLTNRGHEQETYETTGHFLVGSNGFATIGFGWFKFLFLEKFKCDSQVIYYKNLPERLLTKICEFDNVLDLKSLKIKNRKLSFASLEKPKDISLTLKIVSEIKNC